MKCHNCGNQLPNNALFCDNCGQKVESINKTEDLFCGNCGAKLETGMEFCGECGAPVNAAHRTKIVDDEPKKRNKGMLLIISLIAIIAILVTVIIVYMVHPTYNSSIVNATEEPQILTTPTPVPQSTSTPLPQNTSIPAKQKNNETEYDDMANRYVDSHRVDLYNSSLTYKRMPEIHNTVLVDDNTFSVLKNIIDEFEVQCADYMNEVTNEIPSHLKPGSTAFNQQTEYKQKHPTLNQSYQTVDVINARQGGGYYYVWVTEVLDVTENGTSRTNTDHWVYKIENNNGHWYICDYTYDPAF